MTSVSLRALPQVLYRAFDASDDLLYIGVSMCPDRRWVQHATNKLWFRDVAKLTFEHYTDRASVLVAERKAIVAEKPRYNTVHNGTLATSVPSSATPNKLEFSLIGKWFHSWATESCGHRLIEWQGQVIGQANESVYVVQLYNWLMGMPSNQKLVDLDTMIDWTFYDDHKDMRDSYNSYYCSRLKAHERECLD